MEFIRLANDEEGREVVANNIPWFDKPWPPPERIAYVIGKHGHGESLLLDPGHRFPEWEGHPEWEREMETHFEITWWRRVSYSKISDADAAEMTHVARGALFVPGDKPEWWQT